MLTGYPQVSGEYETLSMLLAGHSIARFGDGELKNMGGKKCVPQMFRQGLAEELRKVIASKGDLCLIGIPYICPEMSEARQKSWMNYLPHFPQYLNPKTPYYSAFITRPDSAPWINTQRYFDEFEKLWSGQDITLVWGGYRSLYPAFLRERGAKSVKSVLCSYEDAYAQIDMLEQQVMNAGNERVLLCAGPTATCLAYRLSRRGFHALDLGHIGLMWRKYE